MEFAILTLDFELILKENDEERHRLLQSQGYTRPDVISYSGRGKHSIVCRHWIRGMCMKGDFCDFLHQLSYNRMPVCRSFAKFGYCADLRRGYCPYRHVEEEGDSANDDYTGPLSYGAIPGKQPGHSCADNSIGNVSSSECINYLLGFCKLGNRCKRKHVYRDRKEVPNVLPDWFLDTILQDTSMFPKVVENSELGLKFKEFSTVLNSFGKGDGGAASGSWASGKGGTRDGWFTGASSRQARGWNNESFNSTSWNNATANVVDPWSKVGCGIPGLDSIEGIEYTQNDTIKIYTIKSISMKNICLSCEYGVWATSKTNSRKLSDAFRKTNHVILLFSGNESGGFQGYARMMSLPLNNLYHGLWGPFSDRLAANFRVCWIKKCQLPFDKVSFILNPYNDNLPLKKSRDGQELPLGIGEVLCHKMYDSSDVVLTDPTNT